MKPPESITRPPDFSLLWVSMLLSCNGEYIDLGLLAPMQVGQRDAHQVCKASSHLVLRDEAYEPLGRGKMTVQTESQCMGIESWVDVNFARWSRGPFSVALTCALGEVPISGSWICGHTQPCFPLTLTALP